MYTHIEGTMYGDSYRGYNVWRLISSVKCTEFHIEGSMYGNSHRRYNVWRHI